MKRGLLLLDFYNFKLKVRKESLEKKSQVTLSDFYSLIY